MGAVCDTSQTSGKAPPQRVRRGFICTSLGTLFPSPSAHGLRERPSSSQRRLAWAPTDTHPADLLHTQMSSADDVLLDDGGERPQLVCVSQAASAEPGAGRPAPRQRCEDTSWVSSARSPLAHRHPFRSLVSHRQGWKGLELFSHSMKINRHDFAKELWHHQPLFLHQALHLALPCYNAFPSLF